MGSPAAYAPVARAVLSTLNRTRLDAREVGVALEGLGIAHTAPRARLWMRAAAAAAEAAAAAAASAPPPARDQASDSSDGGEEDGGGSDGGGSARGSARVGAAPQPPALPLALAGGGGGSAAATVDAAGLQALLFIATSCTPPTRITLRDAFCFCCLEPPQPAAAPHAHSPGLVDFAALQATLLLAGARGDTASILRELARLQAGASPDGEAAGAAMRSPAGHAAPPPPPPPPPPLADAASVSPGLRLDYERTLDIFVRLCDPAMARRQRSGVSRGFDALLGQLPGGTLRRRRARRCRGGRRCHDSSRRAACGSSSAGAARGRRLALATGAGGQSGLCPRHSPPARCGHRRRAAGAG